MKKRHFEHFIIKVGIKWSIKQAKATFRALIFYRNKKTAVIF